MGNARVWAAAGLVMVAGCVAGCHGGDGASRVGPGAGQPGVGAGQSGAEAGRTAEELAAEAARAAKYAPTRDYRRERVELIVSMTGGRGSNTENGWGLYRSAVAAMGGMSRYAMDGSPAMARWEKELTPGAETISSDDFLWAAAGLRPQLPAYVAEEGERVVEQFQRSTLPKMLDQLAEETRYFPPIDAAEPAIAILLPGLGEARTTARFNAGRMMVALRKGDEKEFVRAARHNCAVSRATASEAIAISHLVSNAIDTLTMTRVIESTLRRPLSPTLCRELLKLSGEYPGPNYELSMRGEGLYCLDTMHWVYTKGKISDVASLSGEGSGTLKAAATRAMWVTREAALEMAEGYFLAASRLFDADPAVAAKAQAEVDAVQKRSESEPMFRVSYQAFATLMPAMSAIARSERQARSLRGAYRMILAADLYHHEHGSYPEDAGALSATLGGLPRDWFAKDGAALRYRKIDPKQDRLGRSYLVYSVGVDGVDNAGAEDPKNQYKATAGKNPEGLDLVFNWDVAPEPAGR